MSRKLDEFVERFIIHLLNLNECFGQKWMELNA